jgi:hypothetical protein
MVICKLPIPKKLQAWLEKALQEFTTEIKNWKWGKIKWIFMITDLTS